jgi:ABC-2 type transport system ATP-binding protein
METVIKTERLTKIYGGKTIGIKDLTMEVRRGEIYGFLGSNGAGKTTTIRLLLNLIFPTSGSAEVFAKNAAREHIDICALVGYAPSGVRPPRNMTGDEFLNHMGRYYNQNDPKYLQNLLDTFEFSKKDLQRKVKEYSSGMARKIAIIQAFRHKPELVILDEPTEGLDPVMQHHFYELLDDYRNNEGTVFLSSHRLREVEQVCDRAAIIRNGILVTVETVKDLVERTSRIITIHFKKKIPRSVLETGELEIIEFNGERLKAKLKGDINKVINLLAKYEVKDLSLPPLSLEDVFLHYYKEEN